MADARRERPLTRPSNGSPATRIRPAKAAAKAPAWSSMRGRRAAIRRNGSSFAPCESKAGTGRSTPGANIPTADPVPSGWGSDRLSRSVASACGIRLARAN